MAAKPRWKIEPSGRAKAALGSLQQLLQLEQKLGQLSDLERAAWQLMVRSYPERGRPAYAEELQGALNLPDVKAAEAAIARLDSLDLLVLEGGLVSCLYPYSVNPTLHEIHFPTKEEWQPAYASCAIDSLGISLLVDEKVEIATRCAFCDAAIQIVLEKGEAKDVKPDAPKLWVGSQVEGHAAVSLCANTVYACADQHLAAWRGRAAQHDGYALNFGEALFVARELFAGVLTPA